MAGIVAAWELSRPGWQDNLESITVYQRGHRLGGKAASSRGEGGRIEEHGLHVWLGYYDNAFRVMQECYEELDRTTTAPDCPIRTWQEAFFPAADVGVAELHSDDWQVWLADFSGNDLEPGNPDAAPFDTAAIFQRAMQLLTDFMGSADESRPSASPAVFSSSPELHPAHKLRTQYEEVLRTTELGLNAVLSRVVSSLPSDRLERLERPLGQIRSLVASRLDEDGAARRTTLLVDLVATCLLGIATDGLQDDELGFPSIDDQDFLEWLRGHGASEATLGSSLVRGLYDLVFAYEDGDVERPSFPAGLGLFLTGKIFFDYKGSIFWKMAAGMGDVVFAPFYEVLRARGVTFEFFHDVEEIELDESGAEVKAVHLVRQVELTEPASPYEPLVDYLGLPCFPSIPDSSQVRDEANADMESHWGDTSRGDKVILEHGSDFDVVVLAVSLGAIPIVAKQLIERVDGWAEMVEGVPTVATQAMQIWTSQTESELGFEHGGATISGYVEPFDTYASMSHLLRFEPWSQAADGPRSVGYFCSPMPSNVNSDSPLSEVVAERERVSAEGKAFLEDDVSLFWPKALDEEGRFRWDMLTATPDVLGIDRFASQYVRVNVDPSDRYVRSRPGSTKTRLRPDASGVRNLVLAGDWTDSGLNAGCIEAATLSGIQAANAVLGRPRTHRIIGQWPGLQGDTDA